MPARVARPPKARVIPFRRRIARGTKGGDVLAVKRALSKAGYMKWGGFTRTFGIFAERSLKRFQKAHKLKADGVYDLPDHHQLAPAFDDYGAWLMGARAKPGKGTDQETRDAIVAAMFLLYHNRQAVHYTMSGSRMQGVREKIRPPLFPRWEDCSSAATWAYFAAGAPDPNGLGYNGQGYTGTLSRRGAAVPTDKAKPGDLVFYGSGWPYHHVAVYIGGGRVISHGSEGGPYLLPIDYRSDRAMIRTYPLRKSKA